MTPLSVNPFDLSAYSMAEHALGGRYMIRGEIGSGATSCVFVARDMKHGRDVAVKVLRPKLTSSVNAQRFLQEIEIAAGLTHPHILPIHDSGSADGLLYYVMPFVDGETLAGRMKREGPLHIEDALRIAHDVSSALQFAHEHGVIHRDIKPENILLPGGVAVVADFGLARALDRDSGGDRLTEVGVGIGTPRYMSPEQAVGDQKVDERADQYSFACVLHEMLTGRPPFDGYSYQKLLAAHVMDVPALVSTYRTDVSAALDEAIARALAKEPADRFPTMSAFMHALDGSATRLGSGTVRRSMWRLQVFRRSRRQVGAVGALLAAALLVALGLRSWRALKTEAPIDTDQVVIAPFAVVGESLALWREGLMDVLARGLDGTGPLRTVSPTIAMRSWSGRADRASAMALARSTNAGLAVFGELISMGRDSVRAVVTILDTHTDSILGGVEVRQLAERMDLLADTLTMRILTTLGRTRPLTAVLGGSLNARSLPALRAFLKGEQRYRRNDLVGAKPEYEEALAIDSTFALAFRRMRGVLRAIDENDSLSIRYAQRAGALNRGMGVRDSLLIAADSLLVAARPNRSFIDSAELRLQRRRLSLLEEATRRYPGDPEVWYELGEIRAHTYRHGIAADSALAAFMRALAADSLFGPAYFHAIDLTLALHGRAAALKLADRYVRINPNDRRFVVLADLLKGNRTERDLETALTRLPHKEARTIAFLLARSADDDDSGIRMLRLLTKSGGVAGDRTVLAAALRFRGRVREALTVPDSLYVRSGQGFADFMFSVWYLRPSSAPWTAEVDSIVRSRVDASNPDLLPLALAWMGRGGDLAGLNRLDALARSQATAATSDANREGWKYLQGAADAYRAAVQGDTLKAARLFAALADMLAPVVLPTIPVVLDAARILTAAGRASEGAALLDRHPPIPFAITGWTVLWHLERARVALAMKDRVNAVKFLNYARAVWANADPALLAETRTVARLAVRE